MKLNTAEILAFYLEILKGKNFVEKQVREANQNIEEIQNFFHPDVEAPGTCMVTNSNMLRIAENPRFPPPFIYKASNCISQRQTRSLLVLHRLTFMDLPCQWQTAVPWSLILKTI